MGSDPGAGTAGGDADVLGGVIVNKQRQVKKAVKEGYRFDHWF